jgi:hypothetical protein
MRKGSSERAKFLAAGNETKAGAAETKAIPAMYEHETFMRFAYPTVDIYAMPGEGFRHQDLGAVVQAHTIAQTIWAISGA